MYDRDIEEARHLNAEAEMNSVGGDVPDEVVIVVVGQILVTPSTNTPEDLY